jgi:hypothetical protein
LSGLDCDGGIGYEMERKGKERGRIIGGWGTRSGQFFSCSGSNSFIQTTSQRGIGKGVLASDGGLSLVLRLSYKPSLLI